VCIHNVSLPDANFEASFLLVDLTTGVFFFLMVDCRLWMPHSACSLISGVLWIVFESASCSTYFPLLLFFLAAVCMFEAEVCYSSCSLFATAVWNLLLLFVYFLLPAVLTFY
jgi:hypothetical protein